MPLPTVISPGDPGHISHHEEVHGILNAIVSPFTIAQDGSGTFAARPAAGTPGRYYLATDTMVLYRDSGSGWQAVHDMLSTWEASLLSTGNNLAKLIVPSCVASKGVAQTVGNNASVVVTFETDVYDNDTMHDVAALTNRITAKRAGIYLAVSHLEWAIGPTAVGLSMRVNSTSGFANTRLGTGSVTPAVTAVGVVQLAVNDYIECVATQTSSPAASADVGSGRFSAVMLSSV